MLYVCDIGCERTVYICYLCDTCDIGYIVKERSVVNYDKMNGYQRRQLNNVLYTKELGGRVTPPATVATGVGADPKGHGLGGRGGLHGHWSSLARRAKL